MIRRAVNPDTSDTRDSISFVSFANAVFKNPGALIGLAIMISSETATLAGVEPFASWNTPICWTGFIAFADSIVYRIRRDSWIRTSPREFAWLCVASIPLWLVFEFFNRFIRNWYYIGLPENLAVRYFGYAWSFATIWPAIFEGAELIAVWRGSREDDVRPVVGSFSRAGRFSRAEIVSITTGGAMLAWPLVVHSQYLAAPVWLGFIFLLDPINDKLGAESLGRDLRNGRRDRLVNLSLSGVMCGILWEFWNYWARTKWHYTVPIMERAKIFEMPVPGYLGFPAFALECFTMYQFVRIFLAYAVDLRPRRRNVYARSPTVNPQAQLGRTIAL